MAFEVFTETGTRTKEYISVTENKAFGLPRAFIAKQGITRDHKCVILYDKDKKEVALHFTNLNPKHGLAVRIPNDTQGGMVMARSFFDLKDIDASKYAQRYDFSKVDLSELGQDQDGVAYVIKLSPREKKPDSSSTDNAQTDDKDFNWDDF